MPKKSSFPHPSVSNLQPHNSALDRKHVSDRDLYFYAQSFHKAARKLAWSLEFDPGPLTEFDACPVVHMYRHALELHLKAIVLGEGGNFLANRPDSFSVYKTHSVSWLAQFVCQIITTLKWEPEFKCDGVQRLADFKAVVDQLNAVDPGHAFRYPGNVDDGASGPSNAIFSVVEFARRMDTILNLLDETADGLAAEWDVRSSAATQDDVFYGGTDFEQTIQ